MSIRNKDELEMEEKNKRMEQIILWLADSKFVNKFKHTKGFSISKRTDIRLKNGRVLDIIHWLVQEGIINYSIIIGKYNILRSNTEHDFDNNIIFSTILLNDLCKNQYSAFDLPSLSDERKESIRIELLKYTDVTDDPDAVIWPECCILAWKDIETGLIWDASRIFNKTREQYPFEAHKKLNSFNYAGFNDWRIPTCYELMTLVAKEKNNLSYIKKPLMAHVDKHHPCWAASKSKDQFAMDFVTNRMECQDYYKGEMINGKTICVRGEIKISETQWYNSLCNWAAKNDIRYFPMNEDEIRNLTELNCFIQSQSPLKSLPRDIKHLINLKIIEAVCNKIDSIPEEIFLLNQLEEIDFTQNKISEIPKNINKLFNLKSLNLDNNCLEKLPHELFGMISIENLSVSRNSIKILPDEIGEMVNLEELNIAHNNICRIPDAICNLTNLLHLNISGNNIISLPKDIVNLKNISQLNISNNIDLTLTEEQKIWAINSGCKF